ncbi:hypothetical protein IPN35_05660 [Candidatus Peregrinibacteria bacterium]|nr:MAG: hypothetical protein IPN35_05660 [Candidatus Peregrinibacteria bacterium]
MKGFRKIATASVFALSGCATSLPSIEQNNPSIEQNNPNLPIPRITAQIRRTLLDELFAQFQSLPGKRESEGDVTCLYPTDKTKPTICKDSHFVSFRLPHGEQEFLEGDIPVNPEEEKNMRIVYLENDDTCIGDYCPEGGEDFPIWQCYSTEKFQSKKERWMCTFYPRTDENGVPPKDPSRFFASDEEISHFLEQLGILPQNENKKLTTEKQQGEPLFPKDNKRMDRGNILGKI